MRIHRLDAADDRGMREWHAAHRAAHVVGQQDPTPRALEEMRAHFLHDQVGERAWAFAGYDDGRVVATGMLHLPLMDNLHSARVEAATPPEHRRRGHGTAMLEHLTGLAIAEGRRTLTAEATWPYHAAPDGAGTPGADFARRHGFTLSLGDVKRVLALPVDGALLARLAADAAPYHGRYRLRDFTGPVPEDILEEFGGLVGSLVTEAPTGDRDVEPEVFDAARIRADEAELHAAGRSRFTTVAVAPDGGLAAYSELTLPSYDPGHVYQWGTLVLRTHRGHRLGLATKVHNLRRFQQQHPGAARLFTYNAEVNTHMIAVNDALGFRPVARLGEFERKL